MRDDAVPGRIPSPIDEMRVPERLTARVVRPGEEPLLHGFDLHQDLARHYGLAEVVLLALTGAPPTREAGRAFEILLIHACGIGVGEAPSHAAVLARLCGARPSGVAAVAAIGLTEQSRARSEALAPLLSWLREGRPGPAPIDGPTAAAVRLQDDLRGAGVPVDPRDATLGHEAAIVAAMFDLGLRDAWKIEVAWSLARWPIAIAEAMSHEEGALGTYPIRLPPFELVAGGG